MKKVKKHDLIREICEQLEITQIDEKWFSAGSSVTSEAFKAILYSIAEKNGIPPKNLEDYEKLIWKLLHKSNEAMIQAIQTINNPTLIYRLESFLFLFINSWELLLKAKILNDTKDLKKILKEKNMSIGLKKAIDIIFKNPNDSIKENILAIEDLRNQATHLIIPIIPTISINLFQAGIFNYNKLLFSWFDRKIDDKITNSMIFLISSLDPNSVSTKKALISNRITSDVAEVLQKWESNVFKRFKSLPDNSEIIQFAIPLDINLSIVKNPNKADILTSLKNEKDDESLIALKYQRPIDKYPYSFARVWEEIKKTRPPAKKNVVHRLIKNLKIKENTDLSTPNFTTKQQEEEFKKTGKLPKSITFIYNKKALELILDKL